MRNLASEGRTIRAVMLALSALAVALSGCGDECEPLAARCRGNVAETCLRRYEPEEYARWYGQDCGTQMCRIDVHRRAVCAIRETPMERCNAHPDGTVCDGQNLIRCQGGQPVQIWNCAAGETTFTIPSVFRRRSGGHCVQAGDGAACYAESTPIPACEGAHLNQICRANDLIACSGGFAAFVMPCGEEYCINRADRSSFCALSRSPDPLCDSSVAVSYTVCEGNTRVRCTFGYRTDETPCPANHRCTAHSSIQRAVMCSPL